MESTVTEILRNYCGGIALLLDKNFKIERVSNNFKQYTDKDCNEVIGQHIHQLVSLEKNKVFSPSIFNETQKLYGEISKKIFSLSITQFEWKDQNHYLLFCFETKNSPNEPNSKFYREIVDNLPQFIFWKDRNSAFLGCNKNFAKLAGLDNSDDIKGKTDYDLPWSNTEADSYTHDDRIIIKTKQPKLFYEETQKQADGSEMIVLVSKVPLISLDEVVGIICIYQDITEKKSLENKLLKSQENEARFKAMSALGGMIAHELRTPLMGLGLAVVAIERMLPQLIEIYEKSRLEGKAKLIREDRLDGLKHAVMNMRRSIKYAQNTITTILTGFHYGDPSKELTVEAVPIKEIIKKAIDEYPFEINDKNLCSLKHIDDIRVLGEEGMLVHILHNLLKNAIHIIHAENKGKIAIWTALEGNYLHLYFEDTAKGIAPQEIARIFDPFYTTKRATAESIGLGLYFCKMVLQKINASIVCESKLGNYTRFKITLTQSDI